MVLKLVILSILVVATFALSIRIEEDQLWDQYKARFGKNYSPEEDAIRKEIFVNNHRDIAHHNARANLGHRSYYRKINEFADWTPEEIANLMASQVSLDSWARNTRVNATQYIKTGVRTPKSIDWREKSRVTSVKNQGGCGSCWAFSTVTALEGQYARATKKLISFSAQQLVDCDTHDNGCKGGFMDRAYKYIQENGGIESEKDYPYTSGSTGKPTECQWDKSKKATTIDGWEFVKEKDDKAMEEAVATVGPLSVAIFATKHFVSYSHGVYDEDAKCNGKDVNHGVAVVGYGNEDGKDYWIVKNSWGSGWGDGGYAKVVKGVNLCTIESYANYPKIAK